MSTAIIFPGQGSQTVGMGKQLVGSFAGAKLVFEEVDDALKINLSKIIFEGPMETLTLTENAQPSLMAMSMALMRVLETEFDFHVSEQCSFVAGHSLGEYTALTVARSFKIPDVAKLLRARGLAMQDAVPQRSGAMLALIGATLELAEEVASEAAEGEICAASNDNAPGQVVLSGTTSSIDRAIEIGKKKGIRRCLLLPVSAPFHCDLMSPVADLMAKKLAEVGIGQPILPWISNVTAEEETQPKQILELLVKQITARVRWRECVQQMINLGVDKFIEVGSGKVLTGMIKRIDPDVTTINIECEEDIRALMK